MKDKLCLFSENDINYLFFSGEKQNEFIIISSMDGDVISRDIIRTKSNNLLKEVLNYKNYLLSYSLSLHPNYQAHFAYFNGKLDYENSFKKWDLINQC